MLMILMLIECFIIKSVEQMKIMGIFVSEIEL